MAETVPLSPPIQLTAQTAAELAADGKLHFSSFGEDLIALTLLENEPVKGMVVDIGAFHPSKYSNTYLLYLHGWRGLNVEANPEVIPLFRALRPEDITVSAFVSDRVEEVDYYYFAEGARNGKHDLNIKEWNSDAIAQLQITKVEKRTTVPVNYILEQCVGNKKFDFLSIDTEGTDTRILMGIDFKRFRPKVIAIELALEDWQKEPLQSRLNDIGYRLVSQCLHTSILLRND